MKLVYVFDAYCGWSYGFAADLHRVLDVTPTSTLKSSRVACSPARAGCRSGSSGTSRARTPRSAS